MHIGCAFGTNPPLEVDWRTEFIVYSLNNNKIAVSYAPTNSKVVKAFASRPPYPRFSWGILIDFFVGIGRICAKLTSLQLTTWRCCGYITPLVVLYTTREYSKIHNIADMARYLAKLQSTPAAYSHQAGCHAQNHAQINSLRYAVFTVQDANYDGLSCWDATD